MLESLVESVLGPETAGGIDGKPTGRIAVESQHLWEGRHIRDQPLVPTHDTGGAPEPSCEDGGQAGEREIARGIGRVEVVPALSQLLQRRGDATILVDVDVVLSDRAHRDEHHIAVTAECPIPCRARVGGRLGRPCTGPAADSRTSRRGRRRFPRWTRRRRSWLRGGFRNRLDRLWTACDHGGEYENHASHLGQHTACRWTEAFSPSIRAGCSHQVSPYSP